MSEQCPCCGSYDTEVVQEQWDYTPPFGSTVKYPHRFLRCNDCTASVGWDTNEDNAIGEKIRLDADKATVGPMLDYLNSIDFFSDPSICIALGLKVGTTKEWRKGNITPAEIHLLRLLRTFTWLLLIPGKDLDSDYVKHLRTASIAFVIEEERKWHENEIRKWRENEILNKVVVFDHETIL